MPAFDIPTENIVDVRQAIFDDTLFTDRADLNDRTIATTGYTFRNTTGKAFYLSLNDDSLHTTTQTVDKLVREHRVHVKKTPEWRIGLMTPTDNCPTMSNWAPITSVWNWDGTGWVEEKVPVPTYNAEESIQ